MWDVEEYLYRQQHRYELVTNRFGMWVIHETVCHTYSLGMTLDEALQFLKRRGIDINNVPICN